jgi:Glycosyl transferase family 2
MKAPLVSVIMPVYNAQEYVGQAIESILGQTFTDFEFLIFNDGSGDDSRNIIKKYAASDARAILIDDIQNQGYVARLNAGIAMARGRYIARMDADDISLPERLARQVSFMEANPQVGVCGTWFKLFGQADGEIQHPVEHEDIKLGLLRHNSLGHPTVLARASLLRENLYDPGFEPSEDYALWAKLSSITRLHNIPEVLLHYRWHQGNVTQTKAEISRQNSQRAVGILYQALGLSPTAHELALSEAIFRQRPFEPSQHRAIDLLAWANKLVLSNQVTGGVFAADKLNSLLAQYMGKMLTQLPVYHPALLPRVFGARFAPLRHWSIMAKTKFVVKCLLRWKPRA